MADVALFVTCLGEAVQPDVPMAAARVLRAAGLDVEVPPGQTCCGQPAWNSGFAEEAAAVARTSLAALEASGAPTVVVPAGSCATMIRLYWPELFRRVGDHDAARRAEAVAARTRELTEALAEVELPAASGGEPVAYHHSCHMLRELHLHDEPLAALARVEGCEVQPWEGAERCCGFGGTFSVRLPEASVAMADDKLDALPEGATTIVGADSSCLLHLQARATARGLPVRTRHVAEVLADGLAADG